MCRSYIDEKDCNKMEENGPNSFIIVSEDKTVKIFIDEREE